jgi:N-methylhydantoinase A/oxoprolinase/acetone carboxylase beta subunit
VHDGHPRVFFVKRYACIEIVRGQRDMGQSEVGHRKFLPFRGATAGYRNLIGIDIGGTSADITLVHDGEPGLITSGHIGDWPLGLPMIDITTIGAGGGSIARYSPDGALTVGPQSARAEPGPVCYDRGGTEPTVTDAHLVLGHLPPYLLDGTFALDTEGARRAIATASPSRCGSGSKTRRAASLRLPTQRPRTAKSDDK